MKNQIITRGLSLITLAVLTACGGGGGSSPATTTPSTPVVTSCAAGTINYPICATEGSLQAEVPPSYISSTYEYAAFSEINRVRKSIGLGVLNQNKIIDLAALNHINYLKQSFVAGDNYHIEIAGRTGFTGALPIDRMKFAGYVNIKEGSEVAAPDAGKLGVTALLNAIYHREILFSEAMTDIGIVSSVESGTNVDVGYSSYQKVNGDFVGVFPANGDTDITLTHVLESPNPFAGEMEMTLQNMCTKTSSPVSVLVQRFNVLTTKSFTIREYGASKDLSVRLMKQGNGIGMHHAVIIANEPFKAYQRYEVKFEGSVSGASAGKGFDISKTWSFTTGKNIITCN